MPVLSQGRLSADICYSIRYKFRFDLEIVLCTKEFQEDRVHVFSFLLIVCFLRSYSFNIQLRGFIYSQCSVYSCEFKNIFSWNSLYNVMLISIIVVCRFNDINKEHTKNYKGFIKCDSGL